MNRPVPLYSFGICGTTGPEPLYNPSHVLREPTAQVIVRLLNEGPRSEAELARLAPGLAAAIGAAAPSGPAARRPVPPLPFEQAFKRVVGLRAAVRRGSLWHIGFPLLTAEDEAALSQNLEPIACDLAELLLSTRKAVDRELEGVVWGRPLTEVRLVLVGCMALDWAGLAFLGEAGITHPGVDYPDGGKFTILGKERSSFSPPKLYCSSHTAQGERYAFTGFGDNSGPRRGLPDVLWLLESVALQASADLSEETGRALAGIVRAQRPSVIDAAGAILAGEQIDGPVADEVRALLAAIGCMSDGHPEILVLRADHWSAVQAAVDETMKLAGPWTVANRRRIVEATAGTSPARNSVDPAMFFVELWHDVFGAANRIMAEEGWLFDPEPPGPGQARYLTWCAETAVYRQFQEWLRLAPVGWGESS